MNAVSQKPSVHRSSVQGLPSSQSAGTPHGVCPVGTISMAESYLKAQRRVIACAAYLEGEYGYKDLYMGVPVIVGGKGVEKVVQIALTAEEKAMLDKSAEAVRGLITDSAKL